MHEVRHNANPKRGDGRTDDGDDDDGGGGCGGGGDGGVQFESQFRCFFLFFTTIVMFLNWDPGCND